MLLLLVLPLVLPLAPAASLLSASPPFAPALQPVLVNFTTRACLNVKPTTLGQTLKFNDIFTTPREQGCGNDDRGNDGRA